MALLHYYSPVVSTNYFSDGLNLNVVCQFDIVN